MSSSPDDQVIAVTADSGSWTAAISILDCNYQPVAQGVGKLEVKLRPGLYIARYATGTHTVEDLFELTAGDKTRFLDKPVLPLTSPAPLEDTIVGQPSQKARAVELSRQPPIERGLGSELFVFVRSEPQTPEESAGDEPPPVGPTNGLKLCDFAGEVIEDLSTLKSDIGCAGVNVALNPGSYILRLECPGLEALEQTVVTCEHWQTQVFLSLAILCPSDTVRRPAMDDAAIFMKPIGEGFHADAQEAGWVEMARSWLARGEPVVPISRIKEVVATAQEQKRQYGADETMLRDMLRHKFTNPMLGIYAAHLMMIAPAADSAPLLREVLDNLRLLLGEHPDVNTIELWLDENSTVPSFDSPPMLRSSWSILVNRSRVDEKLVPPGSYALRITGRLWGTGVWLVWRTPPPSVAVTPLAQTPRDTQILLEYTRKQMSGKTAADFARQEIANKNLTSVEATVLNYIANVAQSEAIARALSIQLEKSGLFALVKVFFRKLVPSDLARRAHEVAQRNVTKDHMIEALGIPHAALNEAVAGLFQKLELK